MKDKQEIFRELKKMLKKFEKGPLESYDMYSASKVKEKKPAYNLRGKKEVSVAGKKPQKIFFAGIILQKNFVGFYFFPIYSHPKKFKIENPELKKMLKGKSCFNITKLDTDISKELERLVKEGIVLYKKEGWV